MDAYRKIRSCIDIICQIQVQALQHGKRRIERSGVRKLLSRKLGDFLQHSLQRVGGNCRRKKVALCAVYIGSFGRKLKYESHLLHIGIAHGRVLGIGDQLCDIDTVIGLDHPLSFACPGILHVSVSF